MDNYLAIVIGAGTMDVLCYVPSEKMHYKAVVQSPVRTLARSIEATPGDLAVIAHICRSPVRREEVDVGFADNVQFPV